MVSGSWDKKIILWSLTNGKKLLTLNDHNEGILAINLLQQEKSCIFF